MKHKFKIASLSIFTVLASLTSVSAIAGIVTNSEIFTQHHKTNDVAHNHKKMEVPVNQAVPQVDLVVHPDSEKGWNLELKITNFKFAPEMVNKSRIAQEGHAHLYVDGKKVTRLYGTWYYLSNLEPGERKITVALCANTHEELTHNGQAIADTEIVKVMANSHSK